VVIGTDCIGSFKSNYNTKATQNLHERKSDPNMVNLCSMVMEKLTLSQKLHIVNAVVAAGKSNTYVLSSTTFVAGETNIKGAIKNG